MSESICDRCKRDCILRSPSSGHLPPILHCDAFVSIPTNADRIRNMSDEELADVIFYSPFSTKQDALDWLKQEATDG